MLRCAAIGAGDVPENSFARNSCRGHFSGFGEMFLQRSNYRIRCSFFRHHQSINAGLIQRIGGDRSDGRNGHALLQVDKCFIAGNSGKMSLPPWD